MVIFFLTTISICTTFQSVDKIQTSSFTQGLHILITQFPTSLLCLGLLPWFRRVSTSSPVRRE